MIVLLMFTFNLKDELDVMDDDIAYSFDLKKQELFDLKYSKLYNPKKVIELSN